MKKALVLLPRALNPASKGQAVVEYVLILFIIVTSVTVLAVGFRRSIYNLWDTLSREVAAACPRCPRPPR